MKKETRVSSQGRRRRGQFEARPATVSRRLKMDNDVDFGEVNCGCSEERKRENSFVGSDVGRGWVCG